MSALVLLLLAVIFFVPVRWLEWVRATAGRLWRRVADGSRASQSPAPAGLSAAPSAIVSQSAAEEVRPDGRNNQIKSYTPAKPVNWGKALANFAGFIWRWKWVLLALVIFALGVGLLRGAWSPFDLFGPSKEVRAALAEAETRAARAEGALAAYAAKRAEQTHRAERQITEAVSAGQREIEDAALAIDPDVLYDAYLGAYGSLRDHGSNPGDAHPPAFGPDPMRGAGANPV